MEHKKQLQQTLLSVITSPKEKKLCCRADWLFRARSAPHVLRELKAGEPSRLRPADKISLPCSFTVTEPACSLRKHRRSYSHRKGCFLTQKVWGGPERRELRLSTSRTTSTYCIFRMEDVRCRRIIYYNNFTQLTSQSTQILHVVSSVENTGFSEEPCPEHTPAIQ